MRPPSTAALLRRAHRLERLERMFPDGAAPGALRTWPWRALVAAVCCHEGRLLLRHRWRAWTALPGERWSDFPRMVDGVIVDVPRPGVAVLRCATRETLYRFPDALEDGRAAIAPAVWTSPLFPVVWLELADPLGAWWRR